MQINKRPYNFTNNHRKKTDPFYQSSFWRDIRQSILIRDGGLCQECKRKGIIKTGNVCDHITPRKKGGSDTVDNLQILCKTCHDIKSAKEKTH